jgi:hypothetical protein
MAALLFLLTLVLPAVGLLLLAIEFSDEDMKWRSLIWTPAGGGVDVLDELAFGPTIVAPGLGTPLYQRSHAIEGESVAICTPSDACTPEGGGCTGKGGGAAQCRKAMPPVMQGRM